MSIASDNLRVLVSPLDAVKLLAAAAVHLGILATKNSQSKWHNVTMELMHTSINYHGGKLHAEPGLEL